MSRIKMYLKELEQEALTTRKMLQRVPTDKFSWQPHPKSMTIKRLATHIAELPTWITMAIKTDELDFADNPYQPTDVNTTEELLAYFESSLADGRSELKEENENLLDKDWTLRNGQQIYSVEPKADVIRMSINQIIHHRAQLGVFLRLLDIPIPGSFGPSADDMAF
ncbi:damage-inducible protein DinB [Pedobacter ginsengisoli]|uniref:Damage-inducible protein DinB n=1 Tax=Pedobacter ginsengisoli TaxID=363852 RepID=A0A2D1U8J6_9SPHI|nr:DinB family protein [Pedobacter ginsengisoli]ATP57921.1 damage-inducible protein DinB [Pedobacter ginsengisoli]